MRIIIFAMALLLAGCAVPQRVVEPKIQTQIVRVPIAVKCPEVKPGKPDFITDLDLKSYSDYGMVIGLAIDRRQRMAYEQVLEATIEGCMK